MPHTAVAAAAIALHGEKALAAHPADTISPITRATTPPIRVTAISTNTLGGTKTWGKGERKTQRQRLVWSRGRDMVGEGKPHIKWTASDADQQCRDKQKKPAQQCSQNSRAFFSGMTSSRSASGMPRKRRSTMLRCGAAAGRRAQGYQRARHAACCMAPVASPDTARRTIMNLGSASLITSTSLAGICAGSTICAEA